MPLPLEFHMDGGYGIARIAHGPPIHPHHLDSHPLINNNYIICATFCIIVVCWGNYYINLITLPDSQKSSSKKNTITLHDVIKLTVILSSKIIVKTVHKSIIVKCRKSHLRR